MEYCNDYHCAGDCGLPHGDAERVAMQAASGFAERAQWRNEGGGYHWYLCCLKCGSFALAGSTSAHRRWCGG